MYGLAVGSGVSGRTYPRRGGRQHAGRQAEAVLQHGLVDVHRGGGVELDVGRVVRGAGADEAAGLSDVGGERAAPFPDEGGEVGLRQRVEQRHRLVVRPRGPRGGVVLEVLPDAAQVLHDGDLQHREQLARPDPGEHQQMR